MFYNRVGEISQIEFNINIVRWRVFRVVNRRRNKGKRINNSSLFISLLQPRRASPSKYRVRQKSGL